MAEKRNFKRLRLGPEQTALRLPATSQELVDVSLNSGRAQSNPLFDLAQEHPENERVLTITNQLEMRLQVYLQTMIDTEHGTEPAPSQYAVALLELSREPATKRQADPRWRDLQEIEQYIRPEITFLLQKLAGAVPCDSQTLMQRLRTARIEGRSVATIFALWNRLNPFELDKKLLPARVVVVDPLDPTHESTETYWQERRQHQEMYGNATLPGLIELKRINTSTELELVAEAVPAVAEACNTIRKWIETDVGSIRSDVDEAAFAYYSGRIDFMLLPPEQSIPILSALATLKQQVPEIYLRLIGIAPEGNAQTQEVRQSDLFGSPVQIALYRLMHRTDLPETIRTYVDELMQMDVTQTELLYVDDNRFKKISQRLLQEQEREKAEGQQGIPASVLTAMMLVRPEVVQAYQMQQELRRMMEAGAADQVSKMIKRLRVGTPNEVVQILRFFMQPATEPGHEGEQKIDHSEVLKILGERFPLEESFRFRIGQLIEAVVWPEGAHAQLVREGTKLLWMSAPNEALRSREFAEYIVGIADQIHWRHSINLDSGDRVTPWEIRPFLEILGHHKLDETHWSHSASSTRRAINPNSGLVRGIQFDLAQRGENQRIARLTKALVKIFSRLDPYAYLNTSPFEYNAGEYLGAFYRGVKSPELEAMGQSAVNKMHQDPRMKDLPQEAGLALGLMERKGENSFEKRLEFLTHPEILIILQLRLAGVVDQKLLLIPRLTQVAKIGFVKKLSPREKLRLGDQVNALPSSEQTNSVKVEWARALV